MRVWKEIDVRIGKQRPQGRRRAAQQENQKGVALVFALLGILMLSMLAAALMFVTSTEAQASFNYKNQTQARYAAMAGVQRTVNWFKEVYGPWLNPDPVAPPGVLPGTYTWAPPQTPRCPSACPSSTDEVTLVVTNPDGSTGSPNFPNATILGLFTTMSTTDTTMPLGSGVTASFRILRARLLSQEYFLSVDGSNRRAMERWEVTVRGQVSSSLGRTATVEETAIISPAPIPLFSNAIHGQCEVQINGTINTDSYYSTMTPPTYYTGGDAGASVASNSFVGSSGSSGVINGDVYYGFTDGSCAGAVDPTLNAVAEGDIIQQPGFPFPDITPTFVTDTLKNDICDTKSPYYVTIDPKQPPTFRITANPGAAAVPATPPLYGGCSLSSGQVLQLAVPTAAELTALGRDPNEVQNFFLAGLDQQGGEVRVTTQNCLAHQCVPCPGPDGPGGWIANPLLRCAPVQLYLQQQLQLTGSGVQGESPGDPTRFTVLYNGTDPATYAGGPGPNCTGGVFYGTIYAPRADLTISGNPTINGAVTAKNVTVNGNPCVHYDLSLERMRVFLSRFRVVNQSREIF